ncbi:MAG TPA: adenylate/guanylate cyclase domain-containing protein, partial [Intrasporangium sp.]|nr:adenylate/guanylate cyclase domain-containing protein [Intrasporangium sp.]
IPVGTAVHTGDAFVGATALNGSVDDFTALGDTVNTTARLASAAGPGEVLVSNASVAEAHLAVGQEEHRVLNIRGRTEPIEVVVLRHAASDALT